MPPRKAGPKLSDAKIATLEKWIQMGAPAPVGGAVKLTGLSQKARDHWAFKPVQDPALPTKLSNPAWCQNEVDAFVLAKLDAAGLKPNPTADGEALLRRLTYDLHGLPPTNSEAEAFAREFDAAVAELKALGVPPSQCIVVEDAAAGIAAARAAGIRCIGVGENGTDAADLRVRSLDQLPPDAFERQIGRAHV